MSLGRRALACALLALGVPAISAGPAAAHAALLGSAPAAGGRVGIGPPAVVLRFSEPVQILNPTDVTVVDGDGVRIDVGTTRTAAGDASRVVIPLRGPLVPDSYTVRFRVVAADSHSSAEAFVFAVGKAPLGAPILAGAGGLSDTSAAAVGARAAEFIALMLLLGLLAFRALVWDPAVEAARGLRSDEHERAQRSGQSYFWRAFWGLAVLAGVAETAVLGAKAAVVFHTGLITAVVHPADGYRLVAASRFGDLLGWRGGALGLLVAMGFASWNEESEAPPRAGRRGPLAVMALLCVAAMALLAAQGHASQAPLAPLSVAADATHLAAVSLWMGGLACLAAVLMHVPRAIPDGGRAVAVETLARFSRVAVWSVLVIAVTGLARATGELSAPTQFLTTGYGRSLILKTSLLAPILVLARRNRALVARVAGGWEPSATRLRAVARAVRAELAIALAIVVVAAILVAQIPGRT